MRFSLALLTFIPAILAAPTPSRVLVERDDVPAAVTSALPIASTFASDLNAIIARVSKYYTSLTNIPITALPSRTPLRLTINADIAFQRAQKPTPSSSYQYTQAKQAETPTQSPILSLQPWQQLWQEQRNSQP